MEDMKILTENALKEKAFDVLNKALGIAETHRFLTMLHKESTNYVALSRKLFKGKTRKELFNLGKRVWKG
jgi:hypothetical protein